MTEYHERTLEEEHGRLATIVYQASKTAAMSDGHTLYGIVIEKLYEDFLAEHEETGPITDDLNTVIILLAILVRNLVTPVSLCCVVDELLRDIASLL